MRANEVMAFFAERKLEQWLEYHLTRPKGKRNKMTLGVILEKSNLLIIPLSWKSEEEFIYKNVFHVSLN